MTEETRVYRIRLKISTFVDKILCVLKSNEFKKKNFHFHLSTIEIFRFLIEIQIIEYVSISSITE